MLTQEQFFTLVSRIISTTPAAQDGFIAQDGSGEVSLYMYKPERGSNCDCWHGAPVAFLGNLPLHENYHEFCYPISEIMDVAPTFNVQLMEFFKNNGKQRFGLWKVDDTEIYLGNFDDVALMIDPWLGISINPVDVTTNVAKKCTSVLINNMDTEEVKALVGDSVVVEANPHGIRITTKEEDQKAIIRASALAKLTDVEREALGLNN